MLAIRTLARGCKILKGQNIFGIRIPKMKFSSEIESESMEEMPNHEEEESYEKNNTGRGLVLEDIIHHSFVIKSMAKFSNSKVDSSF